MEYLLVFIAIAFIVMTIGIILWLILRSIGLTQALNKLEKEFWSPLLEDLYQEPELRSKHYQFIQSLKKLDKLLESGLKAIYIPKEETFTKLLKHIEKHPADFLGHERFMRVVARMKTINNEMVFNQLIKHVNDFPEDVLAQQRFVVCTQKAHQLPPTMLGLCLSYLDSSPNDPHIHERFMQCVSKIRLLSTERREGIYNKALKILEDNPESYSAKQLVLRVGRWHFGQLGRDGSVKVKDEQKIQNDIKVRSKQ